MYHLCFDVRTSRGRRVRIIEDTDLKIRHTLLYSWTFLPNFVKNLQSRLCVSLAQPLKEPTNFVVMKPLVGDSARGVP
jgi:hypothetical protein